MTFKKTLLTTAAFVTLTGAATAGTELSTDADVKSDVSIEMNDTGMSTDTMAATDAEITTDGETDMTTGGAKLKIGDTKMAEADAKADAEADAAIDAFAGMKVADILGMNVETQDGEIVGEIDYVVKDGDGYSAVIGIGGFLGLGEYTVSLPLEKFEVKDTRLLLNSETEAELKAMPEVDESELEGLDGDYVIS